MRPVRRVNRSHARALKARAKATEARERLTAFEAKGLPEFGDPRWARLCRLATEAERVATRMEQLAKETDNERKRGAAERAKAAGLAARMGSLLELNEERSRLHRVTACKTCGRAVSLLDVAALYGLRWRSVTDYAQQPPARCWYCPECAVWPAAPPPPDGPPVVPEGIAKLAALRANNPRRKRLVIELRRLEELEPERVRAWLAQLATDPRYRSTCARTVADLVQVKP